MQHLHSTPPMPNERGPAHPLPDDLVIPPELDPPPESPLPIPPDELPTTPRPTVLH